jgi:hypothetical protein
MRLTNETDWNTSDLKRLCALVVKHKGSHKNHTIKVVSSRRWVSGLAWIGGSGIVMRVPCPKKGAFQLMSFVLVLDHELDHNLGLRHDTMCGHKGREWEYAKEVAVRAKEKKMPSKQSIAQGRLLKAKEHLKDASRRVKLAQTIQKRWTRRVALYERQLQKLWVGSPNP